jgi:hypothetical protein
VINGYFKPIVNNLYGICHTVAKSSGYPAEIFLRKFLRNIQRGETLLGKLSKTL